MAWVFWNALSARNDLLLGIVTQFCRFVRRISAELPARSPPPQKNNTLCPPLSCCEQMCLRNWDETGCRLSVQFMSVSHIGLCPARGGHGYAGAAPVGCALLRPSRTARHRVCMRPAPRSPAARSWSIIMLQTSPPHTHGRAGTEVSLPPAKQRLWPRGGLHAEGGGGGGHATSRTAPTHQPLGSANAETTPAGAPTAAADRKRRPDATCDGKNG